MIAATSRMRAHAKWVLFSALFVAIAAFAYGCGGDDSSTNTDSDNAAPSVAASVELPAPIVERGVVRVATSADNPPMEFIGADGKTVEGFDADLAAALGEVTGVPFELKNVGFDSIIPGLAAGKYDLAVAGMFDTLERQETLTFVNYQKQGTNLLVPSGNPGGIEALADLCGKTVSAQKASTQAEVVKQESDKHCGDDPIESDVYTDLSQVVLAVTSGRADAAVGPGPSNAEVVKKQPDQLEQVGPNYRVIPVGIPIPKEDADLAGAVEQAIQSLIDDGVYGELMDRWGLTECCSVDKVEVNSATS